ncbi:DUF7281 domain-containing protein [Vreelandella jeotgali]|uniref:DUF7281 domain-containing protein n=1 Tax=Vreelandella jeotgali TaxID=553386 RepID=UPI000345FD18|nr:hypothetical protein [Halomonas jeotgali]
MKRRLAAIQGVLQKRQRRVPASVDWLALHEEWDVGRLRGGYLHLSLEDREVMRQRAIQLYRADPMTLDLEKDRTALTEETANEKLSRQRAFGRLLRVAVPGHGVTVATLEPGQGDELFLPTPPGVLLSVEPSQLLLDTAHITRVLVIENAQLVERWWELVPLLPEAWRHNTLIAYRGHRQDLRSLLEWIKSHREHITLGFYGDFDPHGVRIGLRSYAPLMPPEQFWLIGPDDPASIPRQVNKPDTFASHENTLRYLERHTPISSGFRPLIDHIRRGRWAVTQEALLALSTPLYGFQDNQRSGTPLRDRSF